MPLDIHTEMLIAILSTSPKGKVKIIITSNPINNLDSITTVMLLITTVITVLVGSNNTDRQSVY